MSTATKNGETLPAWDSAVLEFQLWLVEGQECGDSSGGPVSLLVLTTAPGPPDPHAAIDAASGGRYTFYEVDSLRRIGPRKSCAWEDISDAFAWMHDDEVVNQTGYQMDQAVAETIKDGILRAEFGRR